MKFTIQIALILLAFGARSQNLSGLLIDSLSNKPVADVIVLDENSNKLAISNAEGFFNTNVSNCSQLYFHHIGYYPSVLQIKLSNTNAAIRISLQPKFILLDSVIISADLNNLKEMALPTFAQTIKMDDLLQTPSSNIDVFLRKVPGINVNRSWGIFSKNASITMRGLTNSASVLVTLDGVPLNKLAGGSVNWNLMSSSSLSRIEVVKGPNSAQYGMNALGGCVNLQGRRPLKKIEGVFSLYAGTYNTFGAYFYLGGQNQFKKIRYFWNIDASHRTGDGYIYFPENQSTVYSQKTFLKEYSAIVNAGLIWNNKNATNFGILFSNDKRGEGIKVWEADGSFNNYNTNIVWVKHSYSTSKLSLSLLGFSNIENYYRQSENVNNSGLYQYYETVSLKADRGIKLIANYLPVIKNNKISSGIEIRQGDVNATDLYFTSTDKINFKGNLVFAGIFLEDDYKISSKFKTKIAFRYDWAWFSNAQLIVSDPTSVTLFLVPVNDSFSDKQWNGFSPKIGLIYDVSSYTTVYSSFSKGFLPPKIEDMTKSGKIRKGFKMANPNLFPEKLNNYEIGVKSRILKGFSLDWTFYYCRGKDFQYFISKGDSVDVGAESLLPILQKTNIAEVNIYGTDISIEWKPKAFLSLLCNYSYNSSKIGRMNSSSSEVQHLEGKFLAEVPQHILGVYSDIKMKGVNLSLSFNYCSDQWYDDENLEIVEAYSLLNAKISRTFYKKYWLAISIEDILDSQYIDRKGYLSPGRFLMLELRYNF